MKRLCTRAVLTCSVSAGLLAGSLAPASAQPFSATTTYRKSIRKDGSGAVLPLSHDSRDLVFQEYAFIDPTGKISYDPRYLAFATRDGAFDDLPNLSGPVASGRCSGSTFFQVYWVDDYNNSVRCVSADLDNAGVEFQGNHDSFNPKIGGPTDDEGRYVVYESKAKNLWDGKDPQPTPPPAPEPTYTPITEIVVHDRKFEESWLSTSSSEAACRQGAADSLFLSGLSDDGKKILFTTSASNVFNNLNPQCVASGGFPARNVLIRDGSVCDNGSEGAYGVGECYTSVLYDSYGLHAGALVKRGLDDDAFHPTMSADSSIVVFDSQSTVPTHFNPDISGYFDIYYSKDNRFSVVSRAQVPRCSISGVLLPIRNDNEPGNGNSQRPRLDQTGRFVVYDSMATDLVVDSSNADMVCKEGAQTFYPHPKSVSYIPTNGVSQIYIYDAVTRTTEIISKAFGSTGGGNGASTNAWISRDGHYVIFESEATDLLSTATTGFKNIFMYDRVLNATYLVTPGTGGTGLDADAAITHVSNNGLVVAFQSVATNAVPNNSTNGTLTSPNSVQHVYLAQNSCPTDGDGDGVPDCLDLCASDPNKSSPGECGCGVSEQDSDGDLVPNCADVCANAPDTDTDNDTVPDCSDGCPRDVNKTAALSCGCGVPETDSDGDGTADCSDGCPATSKNAPGACGCNVPDTDANGNGAADCLDPTVATQPSAPRIDVTRTSLRRQSARYQLFALLQTFRGRVTYTVTVSRGSFRRSRSTSSRSVLFRDLPKGTYTLRYTVSVGSGSSKVTSKQTTAVIRVPGGLASTSARR